MIDEEILKYALLSFLIFEIIYLVYTIVWYENENESIFEYLFGLFVLTLYWIMYAVKS